LSEGAADAQSWKVTFLGGTIDLDEPPVSQQKAVTPSLPIGAQLPLAMTSVGDRIWIVQIKGGRRMRRRLIDVGIVEGSEATVISRTESGSVIVALQGGRIGLGAGMAHQVIVTTVQQEVAQIATHQHPAHPKKGELAMTTSTLNLDALAVGQSGRIVGYQQSNHAYREKLLSMGLTPGTHFTVTRQAPMGDPIEIEVRGFNLSLRKSEAAALTVEPIAPEEVCHD
ncbi:MAG: FeoA family protein, partial [Cyanobacteria bacterium J06633_23]